MHPKVPPTAWFRPRLPSTTSPWRSQRTDPPFGPSGSGMWRVANSNRPCQLNWVHGTLPHSVAIFNIAGFSKRFKEKVKTVPKEVGLLRRPYGSIICHSWGSPAQTSPRKRNQEWDQKQQQSDHPISVVQLCRNWGRQVESPPGPKRQPAFLIWLLSLLWIRFQKSLYE